MNKNAAKFVLLGVIVSSFIGATGYSLGMNMGNQDLLGSSVDQNEEDVDSSIQSSSSSDTNSSEASSSSSGSEKKSSTSTNNAKKSSSGGASSSPSKTSSSNKSNKTTSSSPSIPSSLKDGEYVGEAKGFKSNIKAVVKVSGGKISSIDISGEDDEPYFGNAKSLISSIISSQSTSVDSVSGATFSSNGIKNAVANALKNAGNSGGSGSLKNSGTQSSTKETKTEEKKKTEQKKEDETKKDDSKNVDSDAQMNNLKDGEYKGEAQGFKSKIVASVKIAGGKISEVTVDGDDDKPFFDDAKKMIPIMKEKNTYSVDTISGATYSSNGIKNAVKDALKKAGMTSKDGGIGELKESLEKISKEYKKGIEKLISEISNINTRVSSSSSDSIVYQGEAKGFKSIIKSKVYIDKYSGKITSISVSGSDDEPFFTNAKAIIPTIIKKQSTDVDLVSGATFSSRGIRDSVSEAIKKIKFFGQKKEDSNTSKTDETVPKEETFIEYEGEAQGFKSVIRAKVKVEDSTGKIVEISVSGKDDRPFFNKSKAVIQSIISSQSTDVDSISGATFSSDGIKNAVADAMKKVNKN